MTDAATTVAAQAETAIAATEQIIKHPNTVVANATTVVAALTAIVALFHPGFKEPVAVQAALSTAAASGAILTQIVHFATRRLVAKK